MSIRPAKFCDHPGCDKLSGRDVEVQRGFIACELCGGDFCRGHHSSLRLANTAFDAPDLDINLCSNCDKFAAGVFNQRVTDAIEDSLLATAKVVREHLKAQWAAEALRKKASQ